MSKHKMLEVTISGSYHTADKDIVDFQDVKGLIPFQEEEVAAMHVRARYAPQWLRAALNEDGKALYPKRIHRIRQVHIDDMKPTTGTLSFVGKDIKELNMEELQDLATAKDLRLVPLWKATDLRDTRVKAYVDYQDKVLEGRPIKYQAEDFNFSKLPPIIIADATPRLDDRIKLTNDDILDQEMAVTSTAGTKGSLTIEEMKTIADQKKIKYEHTISYNELHQRLYGS